MTALLSLLGAQWPAAAAEKSKQATSIVSQQILESRIKEVEATTSLDEASKKKLTELYQRSMTNLEKARAYEADAESFSQARKTAPAEIKELRDSLKQKQKVPAEKSLRISDKAPLQELEQRLQKEKADLAAVEAKLSDLNNLLQVQATRPSASRERLIAAMRQQEAVSVDSKTVVSAGESAAMTQARKWVLET